MKVNNAGGYIKSVSFVQIKCWIYKPILSCLDSFYVDGRSMNLMRGLCAIFAVLHLGLGLTLEIVENRTPLFNCLHAFLQR